VTTAPTSPLPRRTQRERSETTRAALLDAAIACLAEHGYAAATTARVCERAGLTRGAQLHHFPGKTTLLQAAVARLSDEIISAFDRDLAAADRAGDTLAAFLDGIWKTLDGPLFVTALEVTVAARTDPDLRALLAQHVAELREVIRTRVDAVARCVRPHDPQPLADMLDLSVHLVQGFALDGVHQDRRARNARLYALWRGQVEAAAGRR
jgi:AcrR family transcriptional regulator